MESGKVTLHEIGDAMRAGYSAYAIINGVPCDIDLTGDGKSNAARAAAFVQEMQDGREIVIVSGEKDYNSAIMWIDGGTRCGYSKEVGYFETPYKQSDTEKHFESILNGGGYIFARGAIDL